MRSSANNLDRAKRPKGKVLSRVNQDNKPEFSVASGKDRRKKLAYANSLALSGIARSGSTDVSSFKAKHLTDAYASRRDG